MEERGGAANPGLNDFKKALEEMELGMNEKEEVRKAKKGGAAGGEGAAAGKGGDGLGMGMGEGGVLDLGLIKSDPDKLYPLIYYALKVRFRDEAFLSSREEEQRRGGREEGKEGECRAHRFLLRFASIFHSYSEPSRTGNTP